MGALLFVLSTIPVMADSTNVTLPTIPNFKDGWAALGPNVEGQIVHLINIAFSLLVLGALAYTFVGAYNYVSGGRNHNPEQRNNGLSEITNGIVVIFIALIVYGAIIYLFT